MVTSHKYKESKKRASYSMHHFWKQDLSASNPLSNFAADLNVHKNPIVSKYWTLNIIADHFSSPDNNFLKFSGSEQSFISKSSNSGSSSIATSANNSIPQNFTVSSSKIKYCLTSYWSSRSDYGR